ncbi:MAG: hemin uptake protein HemP [Ottowia sp.]|uniref:hemin uptake protein HemP n=1 Tax=unclassified Ottowia TaxID=2645081 RepID=UPI003C300710
MQSSLQTLRLPRATVRSTGVPPTPLQAASAPLPSDDLLQGRKTIEISHNGSVYRLQATKLGKLILTK